VDLDALDRDKKANDPRTAEFRIAQKNASARSAWKSMIRSPRSKSYDSLLTNMLCRCRV